MNARIEVLTSPGQTGALPPLAALSCCSPHIATDNPPWIASWLVASAERGLELVVKYAAWSRNALFPTRAASSDAIILK